MIDWSGCADVEQIPGKVSGASVIKGTRIPADFVIKNSKDFTADEGDMTAEEIAGELYEGLSVATAKRIIAYALEHRGKDAPGPS